MGVGHSPLQPHTPLISSIYLTGYVLCICIGFVSSDIVYKCARQVSINSPCGNKCLHICNIYSNTRCYSPHNVSVCVYNDFHIKWPNRKIKNQLCSGFWFFWSYMWSLGLWKNLTYIPKWLIRYEYLKFMSDYIVIPYNPKIPVVPTNFN